MEDNMKSIIDDSGYSWHYYKGKIRIQGSKGAEQGYYCDSFEDGVKMLKHYGYISDKTNKTLKVETCQFIRATNLVPKNWHNWFFYLFSEDAPFSWGDNNRTLITAERFYNHAKDILDSDDLQASKKNKDNFLKKIKNLGSTYIDLEN
jgi:hypothetical protein